MVNFKEIGKTNIMVFAKMYFPHYFKSEPCNFHRELCGLLEKMTEERTGRLAIAAPRGSAKSSYVGMIYVLWSICYSREKYIIILSDTTEQAEALLSHVKKELEDNEALIRDFPDVCITEKDGKLPSWKKDEIITKNNIKVTALSAGQKIRGRRNQQHRPTLIILDDIENDQNTQSPESREKLFDWFTKAVMKSGSKDTNVIFVGTIQHDDCLLAKFTKDEIPGWQKRIYKAVISFAKREDLWAKWATIYRGQNCYGEDSGAKGAQELFKDNQKEMLEGVEVLWAEREPYYDLMVMREEEGEVSFNSEKQNSPTNLKEAIFKSDRFQYWDDSYKSEEELITALGDKLSFYIGCDPSLGKQGKRGDFSAIIVVAKHCDSKRIYVLVADIAKRSPENFVGAVVSHAEFYRRVRKVFIESNQFQELLVTDIEDKGDELGIPIPTQKVVHSCDKIARIQSLEPWVNGGKILFAHGQRQLLDQLVHFPRGAHDDGPDALEMVVSGAKGDGGIGWATLSGDDPDDDDDDDDEGGYCVNTIL